MLAIPASLSRASSFRIFVDGSFTIEIDEESVMAAGDKSNIMVRRLRQILLAVPKVTLR